MEAVAVAAKGDANNPDLSMFDYPVLPLARRLLDFFVGHGVACFAARESKAQTIALR